MQPTVGRVQEVPLGEVREGHQTPLDGGLPACPPCKWLDDPCRHTDSAQQQ